RPPFLIKGNRAAGDDSPGFRIVYHRGRTVGSVPDKDALSGGRAHFQPATGRNMRVGRVAKDTQVVQAGRFAGDRLHC
ncbi:MAG: hypothetical protein ACK56F_02465, partial [bacterium]